MFLTRIRIISGFILFFAFLLVAKLYFLQIVLHDEYLEKGDRQYTSTLGGLFNRGTIYFSQKDDVLVPAASLESGFIVAINPEQISDLENTYQKINQIIPIDHESFVAKASKKNDSYEEIAKHISVDLGQKTNDLKIKGLSVYKDRWRFYPGSLMAANTIGMLGFKGDEYAGRYGLERQYENTLKRVDETNINFFAQIFADLKSATLAKKNSAIEGDVVTTIEPTVEAALESEISSTSSRWHPEQIGAIILNPTSGEIYAMATLPTFDPNNPGKTKNVSDFSNPLVESTYEMGSVIKPLTLAAGINENLITASSTYYDAGFVMVNGKKINNFDSKVRGTVTMQDAISQSLNVGMAHVEKLLGNDLFTKYFYNFGVSEKTNIDLPNEAKSLTDNLKSPRDIEHVTASFGQGISLTPINTARVLSAVANGGYVIEPHLVKQINYRVGVVGKPSFTPLRQVIKKTTSDELARMMTWSVDHTLQNGTLKLANWSVAAKTGTAQIAKSNGRGYSDTDFLHSFVGFFPSYNPRFLIFIYMVKPQGAKYGSETLSVPFMNLVKFLINYYEVPPDR